MRVLHSAVTLCGIANTGSISPLLSPLSIPQRTLVDTAARELLAAQ